MPTITATMRDKEASIKKEQTEARRRTRRQPATVQGPADDPVATMIRWRQDAKAPVEVPHAVDDAIRRAMATPRQTVAKADPSEVAKFFASTGLTRKQLAEAVGVSTSVIGTVQKGERRPMERGEVRRQRR